MLSIIRISAFASALACYACRPPQKPAQALPEWTLVERGRIESNEATGGLAFTHIISLSVRAKDLFITEFTDPSVMIVSRHGTLIGRIGRSGGGPGEFVAPGGLAWRSDTLVVIDAPGSRISLFTAGGHFIRSVPVRMPPLGDLYALAVPVALTAAGRIVALAQPNLLFLERGLVDQAPLIAFSEDSDFSRTADVDTVGWLDERDRFATFLLPNQNQTVIAQPFGDYSLLAVSRDARRLAVVDRNVAAAPNAYTVTLLSPRGDTVWRRRYDVARDPPSQGAIDAFLRKEARSLSSGAGLTPARAEQIVKRGLFLPNPLPAATDAVFASDNDLWIRGSDNGSQRNVDWEILGPHGTARARLKMPASVRVLDIDGSELWGTSEDSLSVPRIIRYAIVRRQ